MDKLTIVNRMLGSMGERPLNSLVSNHRLLGACLSIIEETNRRLQAEQWWFNTEQTKLYPDSVDKRVYIPNDCLDIRTDQPGAVARGRVLYNTRLGTDVFEVSLVNAEIIRHIPVEEVPELFGTYVMYASTLLFQTQFDADGTRVTQLQGLVQEARAAVRDEQTRQLSINLIDLNRDLSNIIGRVERSWRRINGRGL